MHLGSAGSLVWLEGRACVSGWLWPMVGEVGERGSEVVISRVFWDFAGHVKDLGLDLESI